MVVCAKRAQLVRVILPLGSRTVAHACRASLVRNRLIKCHKCSVGMFQYPIRPDSILLLGRVRKLSDRRGTSIMPAVLPGEFGNVSGLIRVKCPIVR